MAYKAGAAGRIGDQRARVDEYLPEPLPEGFKINFLGGGRDDEADVGMNFGVGFFEYSCGDPQVFHSAVGAGAEKCLVYFYAGNFPYRLDIRGDVRTGDQRLQV